MSRKTIFYLIAITLLLTANLGLMFTDGLQRSSSFDDELFMIKNVDQISSVVISQPNQRIEITKGETSWHLNEKYDVDQNFLQVLFSILNQVKVKRAVGYTNTTPTGNIAIELNDGETSEFDFISDPLGTKSFFLRDGISYQVEVPGYKDNVVNIFKLSEDQWKSRIVFDGSWRTIQKLSLSSGNQRLEIRFSNQFFEVDGISAIDSSAVVDYLNQFQIFQANEMISDGRFPDLDSLKMTSPLAVLALEDIQDPNETTFEIYPNLQGQTYQLVTKNKQTMMVFDRRRIQSILKFNEDFRAK